MRRLIPLILTLFLYSCFIRVYTLPTPIAQKAYSAPCERVISNLTIIVGSKDITKHDNDLFTLKVNKLEFVIQCGDHYSIIYIFGEDKIKAESILTDIENMLKSI